MNVFITNGTFEYLQKIKQAHSNEKMILLGDLDNTLLLHETNGNTVFKEPRSFEVVDANGDFENANFFVMNHIPVTDEGRPLFEHRFKNRDRLIETQPGFAGIRILRPLSNNTYVIVTFWENEAAFNGWKQSTAFGQSHNKSASLQDKTGGEQQNIFSAPSYTTKYSIANEDSNPKEDDWN